MKHIKECLKLIKKLEGNISIRNFAFEKKVDKVIRNFDAVPFDYDSFDYDSFERTTNNKKVVSKFKKEVVENIHLFFTELNLSVLEGEYCSNIFLAQLKEILVLLDNIASCTPLNTDIHEITDYYSVLYDGAIQPIKYCIIEYEELVSLLKQKIEQPNKIHILFEYSKSEYGLEFEFLEMDSVKNLLDYFINFNLALAKIDLKLSINDDIIYELLILNSKINNSGAKYKIILLGKSNCIIFKILRRFEKDPYNYKYSIDFIDKQLNPEEFYEESGGFKNFLDLVKLHYNIKGFTSDVHESFLKALGRLENPKIASSIDFHGVLKYYKDINVNHEKLKERISKFPEYKNDNYSSFNKRAHIVSYKYAENNVLSVDLEDLSKGNIPKEFYDFIRKEFTKCISTQREYSNRNYFSHYKMLSIGLEYVEKLFEDFNKNKKNIFSFLSLFEKIEKELFLSTEWCMDRNYMAYNSFFQDCKQKHDHQGVIIDLFLYSSCILPINYKKQKNDNNDIQSKRKELLSLYRTKESIAIDIEVLEKVKRKVEENERKNIEILSIFAAIVLFVTSNINLYSRIETFSQGLLFMLVMGYIIILFVLAIWMITREPGFYMDRKNYKIPIVHQFLIGIIAVATVFALIVSLRDNRELENSFNGDYEILQKRLDILEGGKETLK